MQSSKKESVGSLKTKEPKLTKIEVDLSVQQLVPAEELVQFVPVTTVGDGSCCFRSISTLVSGDEFLNEELRLRTVVKMSRNEADEDLSDPISAQEKVFPVQEPSIDAAVLGQVWSKFGHPILCRNFSRVYTPAEHTPPFSVLWEHVIAFCNSALFCNPLYVCTLPW